LLAPLILATFALPADPWPGLTGNGVGRMIGRGRMQDAKARGLHRLLVS